MANRFFLTAQVGMANPTNLKDVASLIKKTFKDVSKIETKILTPSNLQDFKRRVKTVLKELSNINTKVTVDTTSITSSKSKIKKAFGTIGEITLKAKVSPSFNTTIDRLNKRLQKIGVINVKLRLPPNFTNIVRQLSALNRSGTFTFNVRGAGLSNVTRQATAAKKSITSLTQQVENFGATSEYAIRRYAAFTLIASNFFALFNAVRNSLGAAIEFEQELTKIRQVTGNSIKDLRILTNEVTRLSTSLGVSSGKLLNVAQVLAQAGIVGKDVTVALDALAKTELSATFEGIENTTEGAIAIMAQFGTQVGDLKSQFSSINAVAGKFAVESSDIITAVRRTGGAFKAAGGDLNELIALFTSVRATTRESAESIATGFRTIFTRLQRVRTQNFLGQLGINLRNEENQFIGPYKAIEKLSEALNSIPTTDPRFAQVIEELGGFRQISKVIPLITQEEKRRQALNVAKRSGNSLDEDAIKAQDTLANKLSKVREEFNALIRDVADSDSFKSFTDLMLNSAKGAIELTKALQPLVPLVSLVGTFSVGVLSKNYFKGFFGNKGGVDYSALPGIRNPVGKQSFGQSFAANPVISTALISAIVPTVLQSVSQYVGTGNTTRPLVDTLSGIGGQTLVYGGIGQQIASFLTDRKRRGNVAKLSGLSSQIAGLRPEYDLNERRIKRERSKLNPDQNLIDTIDARQKAIGNEVDALRKSKQSLLDNTKSIKKFESSIGVLSIGLGAVAAVIDNIVARNFQKSANEALSREDFDAFRSRSSIAGAAGYGAAAIGNLIGPVLYAVATIGATVTTAITGGLALLAAGIGGAVFGYLTSRSEANKEIRNEQFKKEFANTSRILGNVATGRVDALGASSSIISGLTNAQKQLLLNNGPDYETLKGEISNNIVNIETFINKIAETSSTLDEFKSKAGSAVEFLSRFGNVPVEGAGGIYESVLKIIKEQADKRAAVTQFDAAQTQDYQRTSIISSIISELNSLSVGFENVSDSLQRFDSLLAGTVSTYKVNFGSNIFNDVGNIGNGAAFNQTARTIGGFLGPDGTQLANELSFLPSVSRQLPNILLKLATQDTFKEDQDFVGRLGDELDKAGTPKNFIDILTNRATQLIGAQAKPDKLITDINADRFKVAKELTSSLEQITEVFKKAGPEIEKSLNVIEEGFSSFRRIEDDIFQARNKISDILVAREQTFARIENRPENLDELQRINRQRVINAFGGNVGNIADLFTQRRNLRNRIDESTGLINNGSSPEEIQRLIEQRNGFTVQLEKTTRALKQFEESVESDIDIIQKRLDREEQTLQARFEFGRTAAFGSRQDLKDLGINLGAAAVLARNPQDINKIPRNLLPQISNFLDSLGDAELFGKKASDLSKEAIRSNLASGFVQRGLSPADAQQLANLVAGRTSGTKESLKEELSQAYNRAQELQNSFISELQSEQKYLLSNLKELFVNLAADLKSAPLKSQLDTYTAAAEDIKTKRETKEIQAGNIRNVSQLTGFDLTQGKNLDILRNNIGNIQDSLDVKNKLKSLYTLSLPAASTNETLFTYNSKLDKKIGNALSGEEKERILKASGFTETPTTELFQVAANVYKAQQVFNEIRSGQIKSLSSKDKQLNADLGLAFGSSSNPILQNYEQIKQLFEGQTTLEEKTFGDLTNSITRFTKELESNQSRLTGIQTQLDVIEQDRGNRRGYRSGGVVGGSGSGDKIPSLLEPGEFVMTKDAVKRIGVKNLYGMMNGVRKYADGGYVGKLGHYSSPADDQIRKFIAQANQILKQNLGVSIPEVVGNKIYTYDDILTHKLGSGSARGAYLTKSLEGLSGVTGIGNTNKTEAGAMILSRKSAGVPTVLEEVLHGIDYNTAGTGGASSAGKRNPIAKIAQIFGDKAGIEALIKSDLGSIHNEQTLAYYSKNTERFAKPVAKILSGQTRNLEKLAPEKVQQVRELIPELAEYLKKPTIAKRAGFAKRGKLPLPSLPVLPDTTYETSALPKPGTSGPKVSSAHFKKILRPGYLGKHGSNLPTGYQGPKTATIPQLLGRKAGRLKNRTIDKIGQIKGGISDRLGQLKTGVSERASSIASNIGGRVKSVGSRIAANKYVQRGGKFARGAGKVLGPLGQGIVGLNSAIDAYKGNYATATQNLGNLTLTGFGGNVGGNILNNIGAAFGSGAEPVGIFSNSLGEEIDKLRQNNIRSTDEQERYLDDQLRQRNTIKTNRGIEESKKRFNQTAADYRSFLTQKNEKQRIADERFRNDPEADAVKAQIEANKAKLATAGQPNTSLQAALARHEQLSQTTPFKPLVRKPGITLAPKPELRLTPEQIEQRKIASAKSQSDARALQGKADIANYRAAEEKRKNAAYAENKKIIEAAAAERQRSGERALNDRDDRYRKKGFYINDINIPTKTKPTVTPTTQTQPQTRTKPSINRDASFGFQTVGGQTQRLAYDKSNDKTYGGDLAQAMSTFCNETKDLTKAMNAFPHKIELTATHNVNVTHNGGEIFNKLMPAIKELVVATTVDKINEFSKKNFKTIPPMEGGSTPSNSQEK